MFDKTLLLVCDKTTGEWSLVHQSSEANPAELEADKIRLVDAQTPLIIIDTANFINF